MPARLPVVTELQASAVPGTISCTLRSGLRKFTGAKRAMRLPDSVSLPCHIVSRPRPRYSAPCHSTRTRRPRSAAANGRTVCTTFVPCSTSTRSSGAVPITSAASRIGTEPGRMMSPIDASRTGNSSPGASCGSSEKPVTVLVERAAQIEEQPRAGRAVVPPLAQRLEQRIARELRHEVAGETADGAEGRGAGAGGAGATLVIVAVADDPDAVALLERVVQQPLERAPGRMHLDGAFEPSVMGVFEVGVAPADMGDDHGVLAGERAEQLVRGVDGIGRGLALDQDMRRAADGAALAAEEDVAVAAHAGVARPLVAGQADEAAGLVELGRQPVELRPERVGDLEVVALVADDVDEGQVARVAEIALRRAHADGLAALPVQVAPIASDRRRRRPLACGLARASSSPFAMSAKLEIAGVVGDEILDDARTVAGLDRDALRQAAQRPRRHEREASDRRPRSGCPTCPRRRWRGGTARRRPRATARSPSSSPPGRPPDRTRAARAARRIHKWRRRRSRS